MSVSDVQASNSVGHLVHDIGTTIGTVYGNGIDAGSSAYFSNIINFWDAVGYNYQKNDSLTADVIESLKLDQPVLFRGTRYEYENGDTIAHGHVWVVDGSLWGNVRKLVGYSHGLPKYKYIFVNLVHCNWGWDGRNNGFFVIGAFDKKYIQNYELEEGHRAYNSNNKTYTYITTN